MLSDEEVKRRADIAKICEGFDMAAVGFNEHDVFNASAIFLGHLLCGIDAPSEDIPNIAYIHAKIALDAVSVLREADANLDATNLINKAKGAMQ